MDKEPKQENQSLPTSGKPLAPASSATATGGDRLKRDEWSEGAVSSLLEAYEAKWVLRNRAKLKGHDWEDVAKHVSSRANSSKSSKTQTQCKNKIESMKKRYRSESATSDVSSWPLYQRLDLLLRGSSGPAPAPAPALTPAAAICAATPPSPVPLANNSSLMLMEQPSPRAPQQLQSLSPPVAVTVAVTAPVAAVPVDQGIAQNSVDSNGADRENKEYAFETKLYDHQPSDKIAVETDSSTPALYSDDKHKPRSKNHKTRTIDDNKKRQRKEEHWDVAESIRWLAEVVVRSEQVRVETMRELEKMRAEVEVKRGEIELKRTEIIANTQLEIARLFAAGAGKGVDPSLRIGRS